MPDQKRMMNRGGLPLLARAYPGSRGAPGMVGIPRYRPFQEGVCKVRGRATKEGGTQSVHGRSRMTIDPRIPTMPGRRT